MKFGTSDTGTTRVLAYILGALFTGVAVLYFGSAWQRIKANPLKSLISLITGVVVLVAAVVAGYLLF